MLGGVRWIRAEASRGNEDGVGLGNENADIFHIHRRARFQGISPHFCAAGCASSAPRMRCRVFLKDGIKVEVREDGRDTGFAAPAPV